MGTRVVAVGGLLCSLLLLGCSEKVELNNLPEFPSHWKNVSQQGIDTRVGYFESTELELTIQYDIGRLAGKYAQADRHPQRQWYRELRAHGSSFRCLLDHDDTLYVTFPDEGPANFWTTVSDESEVDYVLELLARYRDELLGQ